MQDIWNLLTQVAGLGALLLVTIAGYYLYRWMRARRESRTALFNAERQSAEDRAVRAALTSMGMLGLALIFCGLTLLGNNSTPAAPPPAATDTPRAPQVINVTPTSSPAITQPPPAVTEAVPTPTLTPVALATATGEARKTAVVSGTSEAMLKLRREPSTGADIIAQYPDGTVLEVLDGQQTNQGLVWQRVRDAQGNEGWVANQYLIYNP